MVVTWKYAIDCDRLHPNSTFLVVNLLNAIYDFQEQFLLQLLYPSMFSMPAAVVYITRELCHRCFPSLMITTVNTGSRGDVFVVRTSKPVENVWKNGLFWSCYSFVTHSIDRKPRDWGLARSAYSIKYGKSFLLLGTSCLGRPSGDVPCASEDMACGYWFSKWRTTKSIWVR